MERVLGQTYSRAVERAAEEQRPVLEAWKEEAMKEETRDAMASSKERAESADEESRQKAIKREGRLRRTGTSEREIKEGAQEFLRKFHSEN